MEAFFFSFNGLSNRVEAWVSLALFIARYDDLLPSDKNSNSRNGVFREIERKETYQKIATVIKSDVATSSIGIGNQSVS